jgi:tRNA (adenine22-N1)-methyltransferase
MAEEIGTEDCVVDIGSDHGYLPLLLLNERGCSKVIVTDISPWSLKKAKKNIEKEILSDSGDKTISYRLGDGLGVLSKGEVNIAVIGGMGGLLISQILSQHIEIALSLDKIVMQPRKNQGELRYWLYKNGFTIIREHLAQEGRLICEIIIAEKANNSWDGPAWSPETKIEYQIPTQILSAEEQNLVAPFLAKKLEQEKTVKKALVNLKNSDPKKKEVITERIHYLENLIKKYEEQ